MSYPITLVRPVLSLLQRSRPSGWRERMHRQLAYVAQRQRQRAALARLDARLLRDIGVSAEDAAREARKTFWDD